MKYITQIVFLSLILASCGHGNQGKPADSTTAIDGSTVYACPMDCEKGKMYTKPGQCPVCGMDLEPRAVAAPEELPAEAEALSKETEAIHDEAMKDMAEMNRQSRRIKEMMARMSMTKEVAEKYNDVLAAMEKAEAGMMGWMAEYKKPAGMAKDDAMKYLQDQKQKIEKSRDDIRAAVEAGKKLLPE